jgi:peptidoglycan hydrolase CwlO-like protein
MRWGGARKKTFEGLTLVLQNRTMVPTLEDLDRRATALEAAQGDSTQTLRWVVAKLGRIQAVQDEHTLRLERVEARLDSVESKVDALPRAIAELIDASEKRLMAVIAQR